MAGSLKFLQTQSAAKVAIGVAEFHLMARVQGQNTPFRSENNKSRSRSINRNCPAY